MTQALLQSLCQTAQSSTMHILMTGFSPFDGRLENASWLAVESLASQSPAIDTLEIPVIWGAPLARLKPICASHCPEIIISMGEGHVGEFTVEILARNERAMRTDNRANTPLQRLIDPQGPALRNGSIDSEQLCQRLREHGWPIEYPPMPAHFSVKKPCIPSKASEKIIPTSVRSSLFIYPLTAVNFR